MEGRVGVGRRGERRGRERRMEEIREEGLIGKKGMKMKGKGNCRVRKKGKKA